MHIKLFKKTFYASFLKKMPTSLVQILDDSLTLARAGHLDYPLALANTEYLSKETEYIPWAAAIGELSYIGRMLSRDRFYDSPFRP
jgi:hypothetical protein